MATRCQICKVDVSSAIALKEHSKGRKHKKQAHVYSKQKQKDNCCCVFVRKLTPIHNELELYKYFEQFGPLKEIILDKRRGKYAFVHFKVPRPAHLVLQKNHHSICGSIVEVALENPNLQNKPDRMKDTKEDISFKWQLDQIFEEMYQQRCVADQIYILMCRLELTEEEINRRNNFFISLEDAFRNYLPNLRFEAYGSSVSGLGTHNCDADIFLNVSLVPEKLLGTKINKSVGNLVKRARKWNYSNDQNECLQSVRFILKGISHILRSEIPHVKNVVPILSARCPIVKFVQCAIGLQVDISMTNRLGIANSRLTSLFTKLDNRVKAYLFAVRSFTKIKKIAGNAPNAQFSSYAITMLAIFVLQRLKVPVLPTVDLLKSWADPFDRTTLDGWDCTFTTDINNIPSSSNSSLVDELFFEFCDFVSSFNFKENVICLRTAEIISRDEFKNMMNNQHELKDFKIVKPVCIQDPFDLSHNIAISVTFQTLARMYRECSSALSVMRQDCWRPSNNRECWGFPLLLQWES